MPRFNEWNAENVQIAQTPNALPVKRIKIDLSIERSPLQNNCIVWNVAGLFLRNAAEQNAGNAQVSVDAGANEGNLTANNFFLTGGEVENFPFNKVVISNTQQTGKFLYLEVTDKFELLPQPITNPRNDVGTLDVLNKATAGGVVLDTIQGQFDGAFEKRDFVMSSDESYEAGNREWTRNLKKGALVNPTGNAWWANYTNGFNQISGQSGADNNFRRAFLSDAQTGTLMGGNVGYTAFYRLNFYFNFFNTQNNNIEIIDSALIFGGGAFGLIRPRRESITIGKAGSAISTNTFISYPTIVVPPNRTNDMVLEYIISPIVTTIADFDFDVACTWQRCQKY